MIAVFKADCYASFRFIGGWDGMGLDGVAPSEHSFDLECCGVSFSSFVCSFSRKSLFCHAAGRELTRGRLAGRFKVLFEIVFLLDRMCHVCTVAGSRNLSFVGLVADIRSGWWWTDVDFTLCLHRLLLPAIVYSWEKRKIETVSLEPQHFSVKCKKEAKNLSE